MKIAILSPVYPYRGGIAQFSGMLAKELMQEQHDVQVFNFSRLYPSFLFPGKTQYVGSEDRSNVIESRRLLDSINPVTWLTTAREISRWQPDLLIISYWMSFFVPGYAATARRLAKQCKVIALVHNAIPHEPRFFDRPLASRFFRMCSGFAVLSEKVAQDIRGLRPNAKCMIHPHPLYNQFGSRMDRSEARRMLHIDEHRKTLLFFGLIRDYKGLDLLIDAFGQLTADYQLVIAGECYGSFDKYSEQIAQSPAKERIFVHNEYISDSEIPAYFSSADVCILPYRTATQSGVVSVALQFDLPMIATNVGGLGESIRTPGTGLVAPEVSADSIAATIRQFFATDQNIFTENIHRLKGRLSWSSFTSSLIAFSKTL